MTAPIILTDDELDALSEAGSVIICTSDCCNHYSPDYNPDQPCEQLRLLTSIITSHVGRALRDAADFIDEDMATAWGGDASWLTTGTRVAELVADILRERADEIGGAS